MNLSKKLLELQADLEKASEISSKLHEKDIYMSTFFHLSNDLLCITTHEGYFKVVNQTWTEVLGYSNKELVTKKWIDLVHPDDMERTKAVADSLNKEPLYNFINRFRTKSGKYILLAWNAKQAMDGTVYSCARVI